MLIYDQRHKQERFGQPCSGYGHVLVAGNFFNRFIGIIINEKHIGVFDEPHPDLVQGPGFRVQPLTILIEILKMLLPRIQIEGIDAGYLCIEQVPEFFADQLIDLLHILFGQQTLLNTVDQGQFRFALFQ